MEAVRSIRIFRGDSDIKTWLFSIARHQWFGYLRKKNREIRTVLMGEEPERTRNIVKMRLDGYSFYEIGVKYQISENSARVIDFRTKTKIRNILKKEGYSYDEN